MHTKTFKKTSFCEKFDAFMEKKACFSAEKIYLCALKQDLGKNVRIQDVKKTGTTRIER